MKQFWKDFLGFIVVIFAIIFFLEYIIWFIKLGFGLDKFKLNEFLLFLGMVGASLFGAIKLNYKKGE